MNAIDEIIDRKLKKSPDGFGVDDVTTWLKDIPEIHSFSVFLPFLKKENMSPDMWFALMVIIRNKYIKALASNEEFIGCFEKQTDLSTIESDYDCLNLEDDKSIKLDFSKLENLTKVKLFISKKCEEIILPKQSNIEFVEIVNYSRLEKIANIENSDKINFLAIRKCNKFNCFNNLQALDQLFVLDISQNKDIQSLSFLENNHSIKILQLIDTNVMKLKNTIYHLSRLRNLRILNIKATQVELKILREKMPYCIINGQMGE